MNLSEPSNNSKSTPQLKVVPPKSPMTSTPANIQSELVKSESKSFNFPGKLVVLGVILGSLGYVCLIPKSPYSVRGDATINSSSNARQDVTVKVPGIIEEVSVHPNEQVKAGQKIARLKSDDIENAIANAKTQLGQGEAALQDSLRVVEEWQTRLKGTIVKEQNTREEVSQIRQDIINAKNANIPQIQELQGEIKGLTQKKRNLQSSLNMVQNQLDRIEGVLKQEKEAVISLEHFNNFKEKRDSISGEIAEVDGQIDRKQAQILTIEKDQNDRLRRLEAEVDLAVAERESVEKNIKATGVVVSDRRRQITNLETEVKRQEARRKDLILTASTTGTVITEDLDRQINRWHQAGEKLLEIVDLTKLTVIAEIRQEDEKFIHIGDTVKFYKQGETNPYIAKVESKPSTPPTKENQVKPVWTVRLSIKNDGTNLMKPGMTGYASIETQPMTLFEKMKHEVLKIVRPVFI